MTFFSRISFIFLGAFLAPAVAFSADKPEAENPFNYLVAGTAVEPERLFNVNADEMGPAIFMIAQGRFWTVKDIQNAVLALEALGGDHQLYKMRDDLKKFMALGAEKHSEESLLKNLLANALRGLGQSGHAFTDFPEWHLWLDGISSPPAQNDALEYLKTFVDPWELAPDSKNIVPSPHIAAPELAVAIAKRKKFETIPFPFLYRLKISQVVSGSTIKKGFLCAVVVLGGWKLKSAYSRRIAKYKNHIERQECSRPVKQLAQHHTHLCGPAIALYELDSSNNAGALQKCVKTASGADQGIAGCFWTFEQIAAYKKMVFSDVSKLKNVYEALFGAHVVTVPQMRHRIAVVLDLVVPSVSYDPYSMSAKLSALFNSKRAFRHLSENGKELFALYRWAWFFLRKDVSQSCSQSLLGAELSADDIPKKLYGDVEQIIKADLRRYDIKPASFSSVRNPATLHAPRSVMFYDRRKRSAKGVLELFGLYEAIKANKQATLCSANIFHEMQFWRVLYNPSLCAQPSSPFVFDGVTFVIKQAQDSAFVDPFVIACRAQEKYPYPYFGFGKQGAIATDTLDEDVEGLPRVALRRLPHMEMAGSDEGDGRGSRVVQDISYRENDACKVCDVPAFKSQQRNELGYTKTMPIMDVIQFMPNSSSFVLVGSVMQNLAFSHCLDGLHAEVVFYDDILIFTPSESAEFAAYLKKKPADGGPSHPGKCFNELSKYAHDSFPGAWLSLHGLASKTQCVIELCQDSTSAALYCRTPEDAQKVRAALKGYGLTLATA